jgi:Tfp pilus assembly protein PilF
MHFTGIKSTIMTKKSYKECLRINLDSVDAHNNLGNLLYDMGREEKRMLRRNIEKR